MGNVVNLNKFRKQKAKAQREKQAEVNRRLHGRTKAERLRDDLQKKQLTRGVEGARLSSETGATDGSPTDGAPTDGSPTEEAEPTKE
ncbi:MAG TPA: DUF4169 family protein [Polyangiaceae bacterium]|nr:DUF4169 family protein [Polyangiaceae bacterium]